MGLWPDGKPHSPDEVVSAGQKTGPPIDGNPDLPIVISESEWTSAQAIRNPVFWILNILNSMFLFASAGVNFHFFPFMFGRNIILEVLLVNTLEKLLKNFQKWINRVF